MDAEAQFQSLYREHQPDVLAFFLRRLNRDDAVEATADVFLTAWRRIGEVPNSSEIRPWLFGVAHNVLRNRWRTNRRLDRLRWRVAASEPSDPLRPDAVVVRREQDRDVVVALAQLRPDDREILTLRLWDEVSFKEIGAMLGCSPHAAEQRYAKALKRLRSVFGRTGHVQVRGTAPMEQEQGL